MKFNPSSFGFTTQQVADALYGWLCVALTAAVIGAAIWLVI